MPKLQLNGSPGEVYTNDTGKILYQFHCQFGHSCGVCISYHMAIGTSFPIPLHRGCNCTQTPIFPGQSGEPFVDFREMIRELPPSEQAAVMGRSNLQLVESGVVKYEDVVTRTRVRDLREVVSRGKLSVEEMVDAGVGRRQAERAYETVHTPAHELADAKRRELIDALRGKGIADDAIRRAVSERIALRIGIGEGPSGEGGLGIFPTTPKPPEPEKPKPPPKQKVKKPKPPPPEPKPAPAPKPPPEKVAAPVGTDPLSAARAEQRARNAASASRDPAYGKLQSQFPDLIPDGPIQDRLKAYTLGDAKVKAVVEIGAKYEGIEAGLALDRSRLAREMNDLTRAEREALKPYDGKKIPAKVQAKVDEIQAKYKQAEADRAGVAKRQAELADARRAELASVFKVEKGVEFQARTISSLGVETNDGMTHNLQPVTVERVQTAADWLKSVVAAGSNDAIATRMGEGVNYRAFFSQDHDFMQVAHAENVHTVVHEFGHAIEYRLKTGDRSVLDRSKEFLGYRVGDETPVSLKEKFGKGDATEMGRKDKFDTVFSDYDAHYVGKDYSKTTGGTEILAMGIEQLYLDPVKFAKADPEYFKFVTGSLDGSLR